MTQVDRLLGWTSVKIDQAKVIAKRTGSRLARLGRWAGRGIKRGALVLWNGAKVVGRWTRAKAVGARHVAYRAVGYLGGGGVFVASCVLILLAIVALGVAFVGDGVGYVGNKATDGLVAAGDKLQDGIGAGAARMARGEPVKVQTPEAPAVPTEPAASADPVVLDSWTASQFDKLLESKDTEVLDAIGKLDDEAMASCWGLMTSTYADAGDLTRKSYYMGREYAVKDHLYNLTDLHAVKTATYVATTMKRLPEAIKTAFDQAGVDIKVSHTPFKKGLADEINRLKQVHAQA